MFRSPKILRRLFPLRIWGIVVYEPIVFLTFDDGPNPDITPWVLEFLNKEQIKATFFCVGENVQKHPDLYKQLIADGHQVGNHTMNHLNGMKCANEVYLNSIEQATAYINSKLFRPPYGRLPKKLDKIIAQRYKIIMWSWLSKDYDNTVATQKIIAAAQQIKPGDVLVFHDNSKTKERLKEVLPPIVQLLKTKDFQFQIIA